jgi:hypothetical protein
LIKRSTGEIKSLYLLLLKRSDQGVLSDICPRICTFLDYEKNSIEKSEGSTLIEFAFVAFMLLISFIVIIYISLLIVFTSGVGHSLQLGLKISQTNPDQLEDIYSPDLDDDEYAIFTAWRDSVLTESFNSDVSMLHRIAFAFRPIAMRDVENRPPEELTEFAMLLPGQVLEIKHPKYPDDPLKSIWRHHTHICAPDTVVDDSIAPCPETARRRVPGETFQELIAQYPVELIAHPYLPAYPDMNFAPIVAAGYLTRELFTGSPGPDIDVV